MNSGQIKKSKLAGNFTTLPNGIFQDKNLSLKAVGLLCFLLHLPEKWVVNKTRLHTLLKDGRDAVLAAFAELEKFGYIEAEEIREKGRFVGFNYIVSDFPKKRGENIQEIEEKPETDLPITENTESVEPITEKPITDYPKPEKPKSENPELLNTNSIKDEKSKNETSKDEPPVSKNLFNEPEQHLNGKKKKGSGAQKEKEIIFPWNSVEFFEAWKNWKEYKAGEFSFKYKTLQSEQAALVKLSELSNGSEINAIKIITKTMANGWQGLFALKPEDYGTNKQINHTNGLPGSAKDRGTNELLTSLAEDRRTYYDGKNGAGS